MNTYRPILRPASFATLPSGIKWEYVELPWDSRRTDLPRCNTRYGIISTDRRLTENERISFDLVIV